MELVKVVQQVVGTNATSATANVVSSGIFSLTGTWKGLGATLLRDGIPHGVWFASYEYAKTELGNYRIEKNGGLQSKMILQHQCFLEHCCHNCLGLEGTHSTYI